MKINFWVFFFILCSFLVTMIVIDFFKEQNSNRLFPCLIYCNPSLSPFQSQVLFKTSLLFTKIKISFHKIQKLNYFMISRIIITFQLIIINTINYYCNHPYSYLPYQYHGDDIAASIAFHWPNRHLIVFYLCIHGKCNPWDYVTMTCDLRLFQVWRACFLQVHRFYTSKTQLTCYDLNLKAMVFRKLRNLVVRQAQTAASKETLNNQPSSEDKQPEQF